jgi:hypothetical protein
MDALDNATQVAKQVFIDAKYEELWNKLVPASQKLFGLWFDGSDIEEPPIFNSFSEDIKTVLNERREQILKKKGKGGSRRRARRPSRKYKKSAKRVFRKKSRSTRRR